jgi:hypothetical protein
VRESETWLDGKYVVRRWQPMKILAGVSLSQWAFLLILNTFSLVSPVLSFFPFPASTMVAEAEVDGNGNEQISFFSF